MDFGLFFFGNHAVDRPEANKYQLLLDAVRFADENQFTAVWTPERHFNEFGGLFPNPAVLSAALAMRTSRVQLRSGSIVSPLHHPVRIAEDWAVVDNLSDGRVALSFASGWQCNDFVFFPEHYADRHQHMFAQLDQVRKLWRGETLTLPNGLAEPTAVRIFPKPVQAELPVWVTVSGKTETFVDAGKAGANLLTHLLWQDNRELIAKIDAYRQSLRDHGYDPASRKVSVMVHTFLGEDTEAVKALVRQPLKDYIRASVHLIETMVQGRSAYAAKNHAVGRYGSVEKEQLPPHLLDELLEMAFNRFFEQAGLLGTVDKGYALLEQLRSYGVDEVACLVDFGLPADRVMDGLPFLKQLQDRCRRTAGSAAPLPLTHCPSDLLLRLRENPGLGPLTAAFAGVLVTAPGAAGLAAVAAGDAPCRFAVFDPAATDGALLRPEEHPEQAYALLRESQLLQCFNDVISEEY
jgi:natural product biosynthesis luciferase-like monooxygenase protein